METIIKTVHRAKDRGHADHGWLNAHHSFSFANYHDDEKVHFGLLRVLNDDIVAASKGFGAHPHDNMEIITIPLSGSLQHRDNTGRNEIILSGDVQIMSAGTGIVHSEMNPSPTEVVNLFQIWIFPKERNIKPRYEQKTFEPINRKNKFQVVVSPEQNADSLWINQDAWLSLADLDQKHELTYTRNLEGNGMYIMVIEGNVTIEGEQLNKRDAIGIANASSILIQATENSKILVIEVPLNL